MRAFVVLSLVFFHTKLRNGLLCVEWDVQTTLAVKPTGPLVVIFCVSMDDHSSSWVRVRVSNDSNAVGLTSILDRRQLVF